MDVCSTMSCRVEFYDDIMVPDFIDSLHTHLVRVRIAADSLFLALLSTLATALCFLTCTSLIFVDVDL
jgi:hypothetical protein